MNNEKQTSFRPLNFKKPPHVMVVESRFYDDIADMLLKGAVSVLEGQGVSFEKFTIPGALEIPAAIEFGIETGRYDAYLALGCVIRGGTTHYEIVSGESSRALMDQTIKHKICLGNGILTVENRDQALERADPNKMNKGGSAAQAALEMVALKRILTGA